MSKRGYAPLIWGGLLIILGLFLLAENLDLLGDWKAPVWSLILGAGGLLFLAVYISDRKQWWALIPGLVLLGIAVATFLAEQDLIAGYAVATIIMFTVGLPFLFIFLIDRQQWWALIPALTMAGAAVGVLFEGIGVISGATVGGVIVGGVSLGFVSVYVVDRDQWWALIPGVIMGIVAFFMLLATAFKYVWPLILILLGLLLLWRGLRGKRHKAHLAHIPSAPIPSIEVAEPDPAVEAAQPKREQPLTLEEQIEAAIAEAEAEQTGDAPPPPEMG
jgi:hypothetical protein